jgi:rhodanese-related sulfurtransferase
LQFRKKEKRMGRKSSVTLGVLIIFGMLLGACAKVTPTIAPATATMTELPPTDTPTPGPVDWVTTWKDFLSGMPANSYEIAPADLNDQIQAGKAPFIIDVREPGEVPLSGYIHGAANIPIRSLLRNLDMLPGLAQPIVVYDSNGHRGAMAMAALRLLGYTNVFNLNGGFAAWAGSSIEAGAPGAPVTGTAAMVDPTRLADLNNFLSTLPYNFDGLINSDVLVTINAKTPATFLDVRTPVEVAKTSTILGVTLISINDMFSDMSKLPVEKNTPIIVISTDGQNGAIVTMAMRMLGYTNANSLLLGINGWLADKLPIPK